MTSVPRVLAEEEAGKGVMPLSPPRTPGTPWHPLGHLCSPAASGLGITCHLGRAPHPADPETWDRGRKETPWGVRAVPSCARVGSRGPATSQRRHRNYFLFFLNDLELLAIGGFHIKILISGFS